MISLDCTLTGVVLILCLLLRVCLVAVKRFSENTYFPEMLISGKGKCIQAVWLSRKSFYGKSIPMFGSSKHFTEIVLRKINSGVWFVQTFYGNRFTKNQFRCLVCPNILRKILYGKSIPMFGSVKHFTKNKIRFLRKINSGVWFVDHFTENMKCVTNSSTCII